MYRLYKNHFRFLINSSPSFITNASNQPQNRFCSIFTNTFTIPIATFPSLTSKSYPFTAFRIFPNFVFTSSQLNNGTLNILSFSYSALFLEIYHFFSNICLIVHNVHYFQEPSLCHPSLSVFFDMYTYGLS